MEENPTFTTVTTVLGVVIGAILLGIVGVTLYVAVTSQSGETEVADTATTETAAEEAAAGEGDTAEAESAAEGAGAAETEAAVESEGAGSATAPAAEASTESEASAETVAVAALVLEDQAPTHIVDSFNKGGCAGCHMVPGIPGANGQIGPDLATIGVDGAARVDGMSSEAYITESILEPAAFIAAECPNGACPEGVMLQSFADTLSDDDLDTIVGYLSVLGTEEAVALAPPAETEPVVLDTSMPAESVLEPFIELPRDPADAAMVALGKHLFFDQRLSGNVSLSCASCHQPENAWTDGQALSRGYPSTAYFRNTPTVMNAGYADYLYHDGRMDGNDLPTLVRDHIAEAHFMSMDGRLMVERINQIPAYVDLYDQAFDGEPSYGRTLNAIAAYVRTLNSPPTAYDLYLGGDETALSDDAKAGLELFEGKANCVACHSGDLLTDEEFYNTGVGTDLALFEDPERHLTFRRFFRTLGTPNYRQLSEDVGLYALTLEEEDWGAFNTPSLREVGRTAPYMHDGSLATLADVVAFYNDGGGEGQSAGLESLDLSEEEAAQLVAFLESLSSDPVDVEVPELPSYGLVPLGDSTAPAVVEAAPAAVEATAEDVADEEVAVDDAVEDDDIEGAEEAAAEAEEPVAEEEPAEEAVAEEPTAEEVAEAHEAVEVTDGLIAAFTKGTCNACHVIPEIPGAVGMVGPDLSNIGVDGATRIDGMSAEEYIRQSLEDPMAFNAPACPFGDCILGTMPANVRDMVNDNEFELIVSYLASLGSGG